MFVEVTRLLIVFVSTVAGHAIGKGDAPISGTSAVVGATLGACVGYVAGGILGRVLRMFLGRVEERVERLPAGRMIAGAFGAAFVGGLGGLVAVPFVLLLPPLWGWPLFALVVWVGAYSGYRIGASRFEDLLALAGLSARPLVRATPFGTEQLDANLVDTSAIIDGRLLAVVRAGFIRHALLVPQFVLDELQSIGDAHDPARRRLGRRGLDLLEALQRGGEVDVHVLDDSVPEHDEVDAKLVALARRLRVGLLTVDMGLQRVAELQGVRCLNLHRLADGLRPAHVPGEVVRLPITREGREPGQGVGFLDDGTMVVVGDAAELVGKEVDVRITGNAKTSVGNMLFGSLSSV